jgi:hypothetical protein
MAERTFTLTQSQYEALVEFARRGVVNDDGETNLEQARNLDEFLRSLEVSNDIVRSGVWIQWQELGQPLANDTSFPDKWPPEMRHWLEIIGRPVSRADVDVTVENQATNAHNVLVTKDPAARVGWTPVDDYFVR